MIEGLLNLPWALEAKRRDRLPDYLIDGCESCMKKQSKETRKQIGCGFELVQIKTAPWTPENMDPMWKPPHKDLGITTCPGYTMNLPEVREISQARMFFDKGNLEGFCDDKPTQRLREGVVILEGASSECQRWSMENPVKAGA